MPTGPRPVSNNVKACLEDISAIALSLWPDVAAASQRAEERHQDHILLAQLNRITRGLADIRRHAADAQRNRYEQ